MIWSVSYTHLDVYKRQGPLFAPIINEQNGYLSLIYQNSVVIPFFHSPIQLAINDKIRNNKFN